MWLKHLTKCRTEAFTIYSTVAVIFWTKIENEQFKLIPINVSVWQGSVLGPVLYFQYITDIPENLKLATFDDETSS